MEEHALVQPLQRRRRLETELVGQQLASSRAAQRLDVAAGSVEREHQQLAGASRSGSSRMAASSGP